MKKVGIFVGEKGNWSFFREIFEEINANFDTKVFKERTYQTPLLYGRLNRWAFHNGIRSILRQSDVCFFEWASELLVPATRMPKYCSIITRLHSYELYAWAPDVNWNNVDRIILVSEAMRRKFIELYPTQADKTRVISNGVILNKFRYPREHALRCNIGMLGRITPIKRIYEIILLLSDIRSVITPHLYIGGEIVKSGEVEEYYYAMRSTIYKLGLSNLVTFSGHVSDVPAWLQQIDIFISNSFWEGQQVALLEAMAAGCYCLSHFWDGAEEVLPVEHIYSTEAELKQKLLHYYYESRSEKKHIQLNLRNIACQKFDLNITKKQIIDVIKHLE